MLLLSKRITTKLLAINIEKQEHHEFQEVRRGKRCRRGAFSDGKPALDYVYTSLCKVLHPSRCMHTCIAVAPPIIGACKHACNRSKSGKRLRDETDKWSWFTSRCIDIPVEIMLCDTSDTVWRTKAKCNWWIHLKTSENKSLPIHLRLFKIPSPLEMKRKPQNSSLERVNGNRL